MMTLPPTDELKQAFPPASNQHGESVWPVAMLMVASEMSTGCVMVPEIDAMYGENNSSEADQAKRIIDRLPEDSLILGDSGFGIFQVAFHCADLNREFVFWLSAQRFKSLKKQSRLVAQLRRQAAESVSMKPRRLSFSGVWLTFRYHLLQAPPQSFEQWPQTFAEAIDSRPIGSLLSNRKLSNRNRARSSPRMANP